MVRSIDTRSAANLDLHATEEPSSQATHPTPSPQAAPVASGPATPTRSEQATHRRLSQECEAAARREFGHVVLHHHHAIADMPSGHELQAGAMELREALRSVTPDALRSEIEAAGRAAAEEIEHIMRTPPSGDDQEHAAREAMATNFLIRYPARHGADTDAAVELRHALEAASDVLRQAGDSDFRQADHTVDGMLRANRAVQIVVGGALAVGTGYSLGMWITMRAVLPRLQHLPPALQGFIGGWIVSSVDKIVSSGFAAVAAANQYGRGSLAHVPTLAAGRPSLARVAATAATIAGLGTFVKNLSARGLAVQVTVPDRFVTALTDLTADTFFAFFSAAVGKHLTMQRLSDGQEPLTLMARDDFADELRRFKRPLTAAGAAQGAAANTAVFAKAAGRSVTLPSSWISGLYCASLMATLMQSHDHINRKYGATENIESRMEAFEHTLASSGLMALLVTGAVGIGILGVCDRQRERLLNRITAAFSKPEAQPADAADAAGPTER